MLYKFFLVQWTNPEKHDWTLEVKTNLVEFDITTNIEDLEKISSNKFKNTVKQKARDFEFQRLLNTKKTKSKLDRLYYPEFKIQDYLLLKDMNAS